MITKKTFIFITLAAIACLSSAQGQSLPYSKIYSHCLNADIKSAALLVDEFKSDALDPKSKIFTMEFNARFGSEKDNSTFLKKRTSAIDSLLKCYFDYWRVSLLNPSENYDLMLRNNLSKLLSREYNFDSNQRLLTEDTINYYLTKYISDRGFHTTGYGKTGKLFDLLVWQHEKDTVYNFSTPSEKISSRVVFMDNFITLGWEEYATLDRYYPGGWATEDELYCVRKAYNLESEGFLISYLCHEGKHFSDYRQFPNLSSVDLEYRAKLTELSMLQKNLYETINFFINNSDEKSQNGHSAANYYVIRDLSKIIFKTEFEIDISKWKAIDSEIIHNTSARLLKRSSRQLKNRGKDITHSVRKE